MESFEGILYSLWLYTWQPGMTFEMLDTRQPGTILKVLDTRQPGMILKILDTWQPGKIQKMLDTRGPGMNFKSYLKYSAASLHCSSWVTTALPSIARNQKHKVKSFKINIISLPIFPGHIAYWQLFLLKCHYDQIFGPQFFCRKSKVEVSNKQHAKPLSNTKSGTTFFFEPIPGVFLSAIIQVRITASCCDEQEISGYDINDSTLSNETCSKYMAQQRSQSEILSLLAQF